MLPFHVLCSHVCEAISDFPTALTHFGVKFDCTDLNFFSGMEILFFQEKLDLYGEKNSSNEKAKALPNTTPRDTLW